VLSKLRDHRQTDATENITTVYSQMMIMHKDNIISQNYIFTSANIVMEIEQRLTSHQTHYRSYQGWVFTGPITQPTVSKHWRKTGPKD